MGRRHDLSVALPELSGRWGGQGGGASGPGATPRARGAPEDSCGTRLRLRLTRPSTPFPPWPRLTTPQDIDEKATVLADSAKTFQKSAGAAKRLMRCRYWKMILLFSLLVGVVLVSVRGRARTR